jgi:hypothetical protein
MNPIADNPRLPRFARMTLIAVCLGVVLGVTLLVPALGIPLWPWDIKPFNARFIGVFYLTGWLGALYAAFIGRLSPARGFFREAAVFTGVATLSSLIHRDSFLAERRLSVAVWWITYIGFCAALTWSARMVGGSPQPGRPPGPGQRRLRDLYALLTTAYGLALFAVPATATAFWPWPVDSFHARVYSGIFFAGTAVLLGLRNTETPADLNLAGLLQAVLGLGAIWATWSIDLTAHRVNWSAGGTWLWLALFGGMGLAGLGMLAQARRLRTQGG